MALHKMVQNCLCVGEREGISADTTLHRGEEAGDSCRRPTLVDSCPVSTVGLQMVMEWTAQGPSAKGPSCGGYYRLGVWQRPSVVPIPFILSQEQQLLRGEAINVE